MQGEKETLFKEYLNKLLDIIRTAEKEPWEHELWGLFIYVDDLFESSKKSIVSNKNLDHGSALVLNFNRRLCQFVKALISRFAIHYDINLYRLAVGVCVEITARSVYALIELNSMVSKRAVQAVQIAQVAKLARVRLRTTTPMLTYFDVYGERAAPVRKSEAETRDLVIEEFATAIWATSHSPLQR